MPPIIMGIITIVAMSVSVPHVSTVRLIGIYDRFSLYIVIAITMNAVPSRMA